MRRSRHRRIGRDKTFFIAAIMAMKHSRYVIFVGALAALALMTVLSAAFGFLLPNLIPRTYTHWASVALFGKSSYRWRACDVVESDCWASVFFGGKLIKEGLEMEGGKPSEELEEVENELSKQDKKCDQESGNADDEKSISLSSGILWQSFILTFLAEWGDRSQIATIALAVPTTRVASLNTHMIC
jgi:putative Ca2+/H+ antiporter (TMEM165/GDT1 family)